MNKVNKINHINLKNEDNEVYCCLRNRVVELDDMHRATYCSGCQMFAGTADGKGVVCHWEDHREVSDPHIVVDPFTEWMSNQTRKVSQQAYLSNSELFQPLLP